MGFRVAAIVNEPATVLDRFVDWYLGQGAAVVALYFDNPDHPDIERFSRRDGVQATRCTPAFWSAIGMKPDARFTRRQNAALTHAYRTAPEDWLLNVDADELMFAPGTTLAAWLGRHSGQPTLRIATAEQVHSHSAGQLFRLPIPRDAVNAVYGADADLFRRRFGLIGHADGKSFHRTGRPDLHLRQHWAEDTAGAEVQGARLGAGDGIYLLHFMAPDYAAWRAKLDWRLGSHGFPEPIKERLHQIAASPLPEDGYRALFDTLHRLTPAQVAQLQPIGGLLELAAGFPADSF